ncbi:MAG TPA: NYN domain-containing protein [Acidimicrobiales bacterium]|nr:NYN domain-containing protein [Acidimicrobiales bacterium]
MAAEPVRWLIDGNNVMGSRPDGWWRDRRGAARRLVAELELHPWPEEADVTVVFDGPGGAEPDPPAPDGSHGGSAAGRAPVRVVHSGASRSADDAIVELAGRHDDPVVVVTSDRGLRDRVRALGAEVVPSRTLLGRLNGGGGDHPR